MSKRHSMKWFQMTLHFHDTLTSDIHITPCSVFISHILFWSDYGKRGIWQFFPDPNNPNAPLFRLYGRGYLVVCLMKEGDTTTLTPLGHLEGGYLVASVLREGDAACLSLRPYGRWSHLCSGLHYEEGRPSEPPPPHCYHTRFPLDALFSTGSISLLPLISCFFHLLEGPSPFLILPLPMSYPISPLIWHAQSPFSLLWLS